LNLITGYGVGSHLIAPAALLSNNFEISYGLGELTINPAALNVTVTNQSITYGGFPSYSYSVSGYKYTSDSTSALSTSNIAYSINNGSTNITTNPIPAGNYAINISGLSLTSPSNYVLNVTNGSLVVSPAALTVTADLKYIYRNDPLPAFTSTITGFVPGGQNTVVSGPTYTLNPSNCCTQAGVYSIIPSNLVLAVPGNYNISYVNGPLYVNPKGQGAKKVDVSLICVDTVSNDPSGFIYRARFQYANPNNTPVYIPLGVDNFFTALGSYVGTPPVLFPPGTGMFEIPFDGQKLIWTLKSFNGNQKTSAASEASSTSNKCSAHLNRIVSNVIDITDKLKVYPNPTNDKITITYYSDVEDAMFSLRIIDVFGKLVFMDSKNNFDGIYESKLSLENHPPGIYFVIIEHNGKTEKKSIVVLSK
jgi:hypothetical protein